MATDEAALVLVLPADDIDAVIAKVQTAGTRAVELLVPEGVDILREPHNCDLLHRATRDNVGLLVISSDEPTLTAARQSRLETLGVKEGARLTLPETLPPGVSGIISPYATSKLPEIILPAAPKVSERDASFLEALDALPTAAPASRAAHTPSSSDADFMADLDDLSDMMQASDERARRGEDPYADFAAELDDLSSAFDMGAAGAGAAAASAEHRAAASPAPEPPRRRIRPEDIELTDEEKRRANQRREVSSTIARTRPKESRERGGLQEESGRAAPARAGMPLRTILLVVLVLLLLIIAAFVLFGDSLLGTAPGGGLARLLPFLNNSVTITVVLPPPPTEVQTITAHPVALAPVGTSDSPFAVQAQEIRTTVAYTETGQVTDETLTPAGSARGIVTLYNQNTVPINLPQGTEFVGINAQGNEVYFTSDEAATLAGATTSRQGAQIITTLGQSQVTITARAPGSASNIDANAISQIVVPGQPAIAANAGAILLEHGPITGGDEQPVRIVKDTNVQEIMGAALTGLNNRARQVLEAQVDRLSGLVLEVQTIFPRAAELSRGEGYQRTIMPPVGQPVDTSSPDFSVVVAGNFSALATPQDDKLEQQLQDVLPRLLDHEGRLPAGVRTGILDWHWDGSRLTVDAILEPTGESIPLDEQTRQSIINGVRGKPRAEAEAVLDDFVERGIISSYSVPADLTTLPDEIELQSVPAQQVQ